MYARRRPAGMLTYDLHTERRKKRHTGKPRRGQDLQALLSPRRVSAASNAYKNSLVRGI